MKNIIVEGIDCGGKSTLIRHIKFQLKSRGGYDVKELEHKEKCDSQFKRYAREYLFCENTIFDRSHISECVFGRILRGNQPFSQRELDTLSSIVLSEAVLVLAVPNFESFKIRYAESKKLQVISPDDFYLINKEFLNCCEKLEPIIYNSQSFDEMEYCGKQIIGKL